MYFTCLTCASSWVLIIITKPHLLHLTHDEPFRRRPTAHGWFSLLRLPCLPKWNVRLCMELLALATIWSWQWKSRSLCHFRGDTTVAWRLFIQMKRKEINGCARTGDRRCIPTLCNKSPLPVTIRSCANILAIFLPNGVSPSKNKILH